MLKSLQNLLKCQMQGNDIQISSNCCKRQKVTLTFSEVDEQTIEIVRALKTMKGVVLRLSDTNGHLTLSDDSVKATVV